MQQTTSVSADDSETRGRGFRPTLVYSADGERRAVDGWMRRHGLWRTSLYHLLQRHPSLRLSVDQDALSFRAGDGGFAVSLAESRDGWIIQAGGLTARFSEASHAVGVFNAAVSGAARIVVAAADPGFVEQRLQLADGGGAFVDVVIARDWCEHVTVDMLVNPPL